MRSPTERIDLLEQVLQDLTLLFFLLLQLRLNRIFKPELGYRGFA
jgi:hypothetical protein